VGYVATAQQVSDAYDSMLWQPYDQGPQRCDPYAYGHDCSGSLCAAVTLAAHRNGFKDYWYPDRGGDVTVTMFNACSAAGLVTGWNEAMLWTPGIMRWMPDDPTQGWGNAGHIACTRGNGHQMDECWGGCCVDITDAHMEPWSGWAGYFLDVCYDGSWSPGQATEEPQIMDISFMADSVGHWFACDGRKKWFVNQGWPQLYVDMGWANHLDGRAYAKWVADADINRIPTDTAQNCYDPAVTYG
jgi:hypothetical protein